MRKPATSELEKKENFESPKKILLFACPKFFSGESARLQRNSIENWKRVGVTPHLAGPAIDINSVPEDLDLSVAVVESSGDQSELPDFSDVLNSCQSDEALLLGYANADIIFPDIFKQFSMQGTKRFLGENELPEKFLLLGSRWDFREGVEYTPDHTCDTVERMAAFVCRGAKNGELELNRPDAIDFFFFPAGIFDELKPLIVGRGGYDNALIAYCLRRRISVIDVSRSWPILHQFHGYGHKRGGKKEVYLGSEAMINRSTHDIVRSPPNALDADMVLEDGLLKQLNWRCGFFRRLELIFRYRLNWKLVSYVFRALQRLFGEKKRIENREMVATYFCIAKNVDL